MTIDAARLQRAVWLKVQPVSGGYLVTGGAGGHIVEVDGGRITCHCPDSERMGDGCKHSLAIRLRAGDGEAIDALRALVPAPEGQSAERRKPRSGADAPGSRDSGRTDGSLAKTAREVPPETMFSGDRGDLVR